MFCFICSLILIIFYLFNLVQLVPINWIFYELIYSGLAAFLLIAAALTMIYSSVRWMYAVWIAAAFFCTVSVLAYIVDFFRLLKCMKDNNNAPDRTTYIPAVQSDQTYRS
uniref:MARVEL domain-containing protein n=1 Tax=Plectus sambesii TaxID=2011161 RepID=A0A914X4L4_9BILA